MKEKNSAQQEKTHPLLLPRRGFLKLAGGTTLSSLATPGLLYPWILPALDSGSESVKLPQKRPRLTPCKKTYKEQALSFVNLHTGEILKKCIFWANDQYDSYALKQINHLFRDHRTNVTHPIDKKLLHLLAEIAKKLDTIEPFHLISGFRCETTNRSLPGTARKSQHLYGRAADVAIRGRSLSQLERTARSLRSGGVGYYSRFIHIDTGKVRFWSGGQVI